MSRMQNQTAIALLCAAGIATMAATGMSVAANTPGDEDAAIANGLATMLRAGRTVVSRHQDRINDPNLANKGLDSKTVLAEAVTIFQKTGGGDPAKLDTNSRYSKLVRMQMDAMAEVIDAHQETLNRKGVGFKGFIPAVFGRLSNEAFGRRAIGMAEMKVTAPPQFIRNVKAKADDWEGSVIKGKFLSEAWQGPDFRGSGAGQRQGRAPHHGARILRRLLPELPRLSTGRDRHHRLSERRRPRRRSRRRHQHYAVPLSIPARLSLTLAARRAAGHAPGCARTTTGERGDAWHAR